MENKMVNSINQSEYKNLTSCPLCSNEDLFTALRNPIDKVLHTESFNSQIDLCKKCNHAFLSTRLLPHNQFKAYQNYYTHDQRGKAESGDKFQFFSFMFKNLTHDFKNVFVKRSILKILFHIPFIGFSLQRAIRFIGIPNKDQNLLDVGCGNGEFLHRMRILGIKAEGIDMDPTTIALCRKQDLDVHQYDLGDFNPQKKYNFITCSHVIEHIEDPITYFLKFNELLESDGRVYISTPNFNSYGRMFFKENWRGIDFPRHLHFFSLESLKNLAKNSDYKKVKFLWDRRQALKIIKNSCKISEFSKIKTFLVLFVFSCIYTFVPQKCDVIVLQLIK